MSDLPKIYFSTVFHENWIDIEIIDEVVMLSGPDMLSVEDEIEDEQEEFQLLCMYESLRSHFNSRNLR